MNPADILIDLHPLNQEEKRVVVMALQLFRATSMGRLDRLGEYMEVVLFLEDEKTKTKICDLLKEINRVLWKDRKPRGLSESGVSPILAWQLECRIAQDQEEVFRVTDLLGRVKGGST